MISPSDDATVAAVVAPAPRARPRRADAVARSGPSDTRGATSIPRTRPREPPSRARHEPRRRASCTTRSTRNAPWLHPERRTIQRDLARLGRGRRVAGRRRPASCSRGDGAWSELPHLYARYGTPGTSELIAALRELERARCAIVTDCGMQAVALVADRSSLARGARGRDAAGLQQDPHVLRSEREARRRRRSRSSTTAISPRSPPRCARHALRVRRDVHQSAGPRAGRPGARRARAPRARRAARDRLDDRDAVGVTHAAARSRRRRRGRQPDQGARRPGRRARRLHRDRSTPSSRTRSWISIAMRGGILDDDRARRVAANLANAERVHARRCATAARVAAFLARHPRDRARVPSEPARSSRRRGDRARLHAHRLAAQLSRRRRRRSCHRRIADVLVSCGVLRYALSFDGLVTKVNHHRTVSEYFTPPDVVARLGIDRLIRLGIGIEDADDLDRVPQLDAASRLGRTLLLSQPTRLNDFANLIGDAFSLLNFRIRKLEEKASSTVEIARKRWLRKEQASLEQAAETRIGRPPPQEPVEHVVRELRHREQRRDEHRRAADVEAGAEQPAVVVPDRAVPAASPRRTRPATASRGTRRARDRGRASARWHRRAIGLARRRSRRRRRRAPCTGCRGRTRS